MISDGQISDFDQVECVTWSALKAAGRAFRTEAVCMVLVTEGTFLVRQGAAFQRLTGPSHNCFTGPLTVGCASAAGQAILLTLPISQLHLLPQSAFVTQLATPESAASPEPLPLNLHMQAVAHGLLSLPVAAPQQPIYLLAKAIEILALQADQIASLPQKATRHARTAYDRERLQYARELLLARMALPPSIPELALAAGINEFKLKQGFKELFGTTVYGLLAEERLQRAHEMLGAGAMSATEVAFELGYASPQHFSLRFKERFGVAPATLRKAQLKG